MGNINKMTEEILKGDPAIGAYNSCIETAEPPLLDPRLFSD